VASTATQAEVAVEVVSMVTQAEVAVEMVFMVTQVEVEEAGVATKSHVHTSKVHLAAKRATNAICSTGRASQLEEVMEEEHQECMVVVLEVKEDSASSTLMLEDIHINNSTMEEQI
jgi:hypothetical protein